MWGEAAVRLEVGDQLDEDGLGGIHQGTLAQRPVLVRRLRDRLNEAPEVLARLEEQLPRLRAFQHPNVVPLMDLRLQETPRSVVYEAPKGRPLRDVLRERRRLTVNQAITIGKGIATALQAAHAQGWVHGDLRTRNVFVGGAGEVELLGFGLAEATCAASGYEALDMAFGHPLYLAPEGVGAPAPTPATDVYALGILLQRMVLGSHPYKSKDLREVLQRHQTDSLPTEHRGVTIPPKLAAVLAAMTAKDPAARPALGPTLFAELHQVDAFEGSLCEEDSPLIPLPPTPAKDDDSNDETPEPDEDESGAGAILPAAPAGAETMREALQSAVEHQRATEELRRSSGRVRAASVTTATGPGAPRPGLNGGQLLVSVLGLAAVVLGMVAIANVQRSTAEAPEAAAARPEPTRVAPPPPSEAATQQREREAKALAAVETIGGELDAAVEDDLDRARDLFKKLPKDVTDEAGRKRVEALRAKLHSAGEQALVKELKTIGSRLEAGDLWGGEAAWRRMQARYRKRPQLLHKPEVAAVVARIQRWERARGWEVARLRSPKALDVQVVQGRLTTGLKGWADGGRIYYGGGVRLRYHSAAQLLADLKPRDEAKKHADSVGAGKRKQAAVCLAKGDHTLALPLRRPLDVTLELVLQAKPGAEQRFEVYCGRVGTDFGLRTIAGKRGPASAAVTSLPVNRPLRLRLRFDDRSARTLTLRSSLHGPGGPIGAEGRAQVDRADARGRLTLRVRKGAVWITQLEVRGALDAGKLK